MAIPQPLHPVTDRDPFAPRRASRNELPLGELLVRWAIVTRTDLERGLRRQAAEGGRLGTCLLEIGAVDEPTLAAMLAAQRHVEPARPEALGAPAAECTRRLSARTAGLLHALPLRVVPGGIAVALEDPTDLATVDRVRAALGARVVPLLALELSLAEALHRTYAVAVPDRLARARRKMEERLRLAALDADAFDAPETRQRPIELLRPID